ncbi:MAG: FAD-dependent oxidoreductase, partial [Angelakisella sp.]
MGQYTILNDKVICDEQEIPVVWSGDVLVAGGGPGGLAAAFMAQRNGLRVMLLDELGFLGGMASYGCGMPLGGSYPAYRSNGGFAEEIIDAVRNAGKDAADVRVMGQFSYWFFHDSEYFKSFIAKKVVDEKLPVRLHTTVCDVIMQGTTTVAGLIVESKSGRQALMGKVIIDATGDADVCARAGADFVMGRDGDGSLMASTVVFSLANVDTERAMAYKEQDPRFEKAIARAAQDGVFVHPDDKMGNFVSVLRERTIFCNSVRVRDIDGTNVEDLTKAELEARIRILQQLIFVRKYLPGFENCYIGSTGARLGVRETRRIIGEDILTTEDVSSYRKREDVGVIRSAGPYDD